MPTPANFPWPAGSWDVTDEIMAILADLNIATELDRVEKLAWPALHAQDPTDEEPAVIDPPTSH